VFYLRRKKDERAQTSDSHGSPRLLPPGHGPGRLPQEAEYPSLPPTYAIKDDAWLVNFAANEHRDGPAAAGSSQVALPDGRTQTVTYTAGLDGIVESWKALGWEMTSWGKGPTTAACNEYCDISWPAQFAFSHQLGSYQLTNKHFFFLL
jgi:hypothetical protein